MDHSSVQLRRDILAAEAGTRVKDAIGRNPVSLIAQLVAFVIFVSSVRGGRDMIRGYVDL